MWCACAAERLQTGTLQNPLSRLSTRFGIVLGLVPCVALPGTLPELLVARAHICAVGNRLGRRDRRRPAEGRPLLRLLLEPLLQRLEVIGGRAEQSASRAA